nr:DUF6034 family protein [uncultured Blautia sp.]
MGKGSGVFCAMLFSCLLLTGCAENPTEDIVVNKNEGKLEQAIQGENKKDSDASVPEKYTDQFQADGEKIEVSVDASVTGLEENKPVVRVKPHVITEEEAKQWADVLFEGATAYEPGEKSKTEIEDRILQLKERISDQDKLLEDYGSQEEADRIKKELEEEIKEYEKQYASASDADEKIPCTWEFHPYGYYDDLPMPTSGDANYEGLDKTSQLIAQATVNGHQAMVEVDNREESDYRLNTQWFLYEDEQEWVKEETGTLSKEEAVKQADEIKNQLGMENWKYAEYKTSEAESIQNIMVTYTPSYENITAFQGPLIDLKSEDLYAANYYYSSLSIGFENGVLTSVELISPMDVVQIENENVETMDFEEIYQTFKKQAQAQFTESAFLDSDATETGTIQIEISEITEGLFRIKEKSNTEDFLMVPAWSFSGTLRVDGDDWGKQEFLMINGIDGSVINTSLGY